MARFDVGPCFAKARYTCGLTKHSMTLPLNGIVGNEGVVSGTPYELKTKDNETMTAETWAGAFGLLLRSYFGPDSQYEGMDFFYRQAVGRAPIWVYTSNTNAGIGTHETALKDPYGQMTLSFRSGHGNHYRFQVMEAGLFVPNHVFTIAELEVSPLVNTLTMVMGGLSPIVARDGSPIIGLIRGLTKTNDRLRKRGLR